MEKIFADDAFTGLEAAIVLIAFVVVAAVFSYVLLGAGFYTTQTAQETVHTGVAQASSSLEIVGDVMGISYTSGTKERLTFLNTSVALTAGGTSMDLTQMVISYSDNNGGRNADVKPNHESDITECTTANSGAVNVMTTDTTTSADQRWCVSQKINTVGAENNLLEPNEIWMLSIGLPKTATPNTVITVNMQPAIGAFVPITRSLPGGLTAVQAIH